MADLTPMERAQRFHPCGCEQATKSWRDKQGNCGLCRLHRTRLADLIREVYEDAAKVLDQEGQELRADNRKRSAYYYEEAAEKIRARAKEAPSS